MLQTFWSWLYVFRLENQNEKYAIVKLKPSSQLSLNLLLWLELSIFIKVTFGPENFFFCCSQYTEKDITFVVVGQSSQVMVGYIPKHSIYIFLLKNPSISHSFCTTKHYLIMWFSVFWSWGLVLVVCSAAVVVMEPPPFFRCISHPIHYIALLYAFPLSSSAPHVNAEKSLLVYLILCTKHLERRIPTASTFFLESTWPSF